MAAGMPIVGSLFIPHLTVGGERWDQLAWQYYGDSTLYGPIVMANPAIPIEPAFEAGLTIGIPLLSSPTSASIPQADLPPWQRISG
jgi:phage tail protein X